MQAALTDCKHEEGPSGYVHRQNWAAKRLKAGWKQVKCKKCKLWAIWIKPDALNSSSQIADKESK